MCYLKNLPSQESIDFTDYFNKGEETCVEPTEEERNVLIPCAHKHIEPHWSDEQQMLVKLFQMILKNNTLIKALHQVYLFLTQSLTNSSVETFEKQVETAQIPVQTLESFGSSKTDESSSDIPNESKNVCTRLFGNHKYKYFLQLSEDFPEVVYKERNFNLAIKLVDANDKVARNCISILNLGNILNLCCAVSTTNAEWIHENRVGEPFLKGKTEIELYKGEASFSKIYARDVSRIYPEGKVNLIIYTKPSTLIYTGNNSLEVPINSEEIEPLIIPDLTIKAKKKE